MENERRQRELYDHIARFYDPIQKLGARLRGFSDTGERRKMVDRLALRPGHRVLEVSVGTGANLPLVTEGIGDAGLAVGLDISRGMLGQCLRKLRRRPGATALVEGEAAHLPFPDNSFDAVLHFGGINAFGDRKGAIDEMARVARAGAKIVIGDEGLAPDKPVSFRNRLLMRLSSLYQSQPPLDLLPPEARDVRVVWFRGDACYLIDFVNP